MLGPGEVGEDLAARTERPGVPAVEGQGRREDRDGSVALAKSPEGEGEVRPDDRITWHPVHCRLEYFDRVLRALLGYEQLPHGGELAGHGGRVVQCPEEFGGGPVVALGLRLGLRCRAALGRDVAEERLGLGVEPQVGVG